MSFAFGLYRDSATNTRLNSAYPTGLVPTSNVIPIMLDGSHTYRGTETTSVSVSLVGGQTYLGSMDAGSAANSLWYHFAEGRLDYLEFTGDFDVEFINIGLASGATSGQYQFGGVIAWLSATNSEFGVIGTRDTTTSTIEYKATVAGSSDVLDMGANRVTGNRGDINVRRSGSVLTWFYRETGDTDWLTIPMSDLNPRVNFGTGAIRVGIATYGSGTVSAFTTECDEVIVNSGSYV